MKWRDKMKIRKIMLMTMIGVFSVFGFSCSKTGNEKNDTANNNRINLCIRNFMW